MLSERDEYDAVIMGGGIAGLSCGLRLVEQGARVLVCEKGEGAGYPCNSRMSGGFFHLAMGRIEQDPLTLWSKLDCTEQTFGSEALYDAVYARVSQVIPWLRANGVLFIRGGGLDWQRWVLAPPAMARAGYEFRGRAGDYALRVLLARFIELGGDFRLNTRVVDIQHKGDRVESVRLRVSAAEEEVVRCKSVVIADGGFQGNADLVSRHVAPTAENVATRGAGTSHGDGLRMAVGLGAASRGLEAFYGHLLAHAARRNPRLSPFPVVDPLVAAGIVVDETGNRLLDESRSGVYVANAVARLPAGKRAFVIFDSCVWNGVGRLGTCPCNPTLEREAAGIVRANSLPDLAAQLGVPAAPLEFEVANRNAAISQREGQGQSAALAATIVEPPYFGLRICAGLTYTMGGIAIDEECRVIDWAGVPIVGLYAAGTAVGGLEGGPEVVYMGGLARSVATAFIAAESVCRATRAVSGGGTGGHDPNVCERG